MTRAMIRNIDGKLVLDDPDALAVARVVDRENIRRFIFEGATKERVGHFMDRLDARGDDGTLLMIVILCVDDANGAILADHLMPNHDWEAIRARGEVPFARGLVERAGIQSGLDAMFPEAATELRELKGVAVLAMDRGIVTVFDAITELFGAAP